MAIISAGWPGAHMVAARIKACLAAYHQCRLNDYYSVSATMTIQSMYNGNETVMAMAIKYNMQLLKYNGSISFLSSNNLK